MPYKTTEAAKTDKSVVQVKDGKPDLEVNSPLVSADKPQESPSDIQTTKAELKPVNKRVMELKTNVVMGPPASSTERQKSSTRECYVTPCKNKHGFSQESPLHISKIAESTPENDTCWPDDSSHITPKGPFFVSTPQSPYGQVLKPNPSPETRKNWKKWIDNFPDFQKERSPPKRKRKLSTVRYFIV